MSRLLLTIATISFAICSAARAETIGDVVVGPRPAQPNPPEVTRCDRLTAYASDRERLVAESVPRSAIDVDDAIDACRTAVDTHPSSGRLHYHLARVLGYAEDADGAAHHRRQAAAAGYPSAVFILGLLKTTSAGDNVQETCLGARLMETSARMGGFAGQLAYPAYRLEGRFEVCEGLAAAAELRTFLTQAEARAEDFYERVFIGHLQQDLNRRANANGAHDGRAAAHGD